MRLIDADVLKEEICKRYMHFSRRILTLYPVFEEIKKAPSLDAVLVTRCKDCTKREYCRTSTVWAVAPNDDWYCADGERKEK